MVSGRPPQRSVATFVRPSVLPYINTRNTARITNHKPANHDFQNARMQLATSIAIIRRVATSGRHCWSNG